MCPTWTWVECPIVRTQEPACGFWSHCAFVHTVRRAWRVAGYLHAHPGSLQPMTGAHEGRPGAPFLLLPVFILWLLSVEPASPASSPASGKGATFSGHPHGTVSAAHGSSFMCYVSTPLPAEEWRSLRGGGWVQFLAQCPSYQLFWSACSNSHCSHTPAFLYFLKTRGIVQLNVLRMDWLRNSTSLFHFGIFIHVCSLLLWSLCSEEKKKPINATCPFFWTTFPSLFLVCSKFLYLPQYVRTLCCLKIETQFKICKN